MKKIQIPYAATNYFSKVVIDYLNGAEEVKSFYLFAPEIASFPKVIENRNSFTTNRKVLYDVLMQQHENMLDRNKTGKVFENIESLKQPATFTVTTAHQPNLFLGPLFLIYKIISTINLAKSLNNQFPGYHFVPVFWMGSEDHDKEELNHIHLFGKTFKWETNQEGAFGSMKTESLASLIDEIKTMLGESQQAKQCGELLEQYYLKEETIASATKKILYHFFAEDGLVIIDGDDHELKKLFIPVLEKEMLSQFSFPIVNESILELPKKYTSQISPREINLFYLDKGIRQRIVKENDRWNVLNTSLSFSEKEITSLIQSHPEKFSPNVVLRPVYQEMVLPNLAFLGGGAEITYWMQLKSLFDALHVPFPVVMLRNSALWIDRNNAVRMQKLSISEEMIFQPTEIIIKNFLQKQSGDLISMEKEKKILSELLDKTMERVSTMDASLKGSFEAEKVKMVKSLETLEDKLRRSAKKKEETSVQQIHALKEKLFPENGLQERYDNFLSYYSKYGDPYFSELRSNLDPLEMKFTVMVEE